MLVVVSGTETGQPIDQDDFRPCRDAGLLWTVVCNVRTLVGVKDDETRRRQWCENGAHLFDADLLEHGGWLQSHATQLALRNPKIFLPVAPFGKSVNISPR